MTLLGFLFSCVSAYFLLSLPKRWAPLPLLMGAAYMTLGQQIQIGPFHFPVIRILIATGFLRIVLKGEHIAGGWRPLDTMMIIWASWAVFSVAFHAAGALVSRLGIIYNDLGIYFLMRIFVREIEDIRTVFKILCIVLIPLAFAMVLEKMTQTNFFALLLGGVPEEVALREGRFRAHGPFRHAILAGTVGAVCLPMALSLWRQNRKLAWIGAASASAIVFASGSSGPIMTVLAISFALAIWRIQGHLRKILWASLILVLALDVVMNDPVYFLLARIDITGGSTGWHRAALIGAAIEHLDEWWLGGTDYTRHWMPTGVHWTEKHTDITNHYLQMGVLGGLPLMLLFVGILYSGFASVREALRLSKNAPNQHRFLIWTLGSILFGHAVTFMSISYFDQTVVFFYLVLAAVGSLHAMKTVRVMVPDPATASRTDCAVAHS